MVGRKVRFTLGEGGTFWYQKVDELDLGLGVVVKDVPMTLVWGPSDIGDFFTAVYGHHNLREIKRRLMFFVDARATDIIDRFDREE